MRPRRGGPTSPTSPTFEPGALSGSRRRAVAGDAGDGSAVPHGTGGQGAEAVDDPPPPGLDQRGPPSGRFRDPDDRSRREGGVGRRPADSGHGTPQNASGTNQGHHGNGRSPRRRPGRRPGPDALAVRVRRCTASQRACGARHRRRDRGRRRSAACLAQVQDRPRSRGSDPRPPVRQSPGDVPSARMAAMAQRFGHRHGPGVPVRRSPRQPRRQAALPDRAVADMVKRGPGCAPRGPARRR